MRLDADENGFKIRFYLCHEDGYDVIVVEYGYGGSVVACRMSMTGINPY